MREEIAAAVVFMTRLLKKNCGVTSEKAEEFSNNLSAILLERFRDHWYTDKPSKGQGYRCIRINWGEPFDPVIAKAAQSSGLRENELFRLLFPVDMTLWVDPEDVSCRFGESYGHICTLAKAKNGNLENVSHTINLDEIIEQEKEKHNQQVNIVTTRSTVSQHGSNKQHHLRGMYQGKSTGYYSNLTNKTNNYYNQHYNRRRLNSEGSSKSYSSGEEQVNGVRDSPEHVNEVREQFRLQVSQAMGNLSKPTAVKANSPGPQGGDGAEEKSSDVSAQLSDSTTSLLSSSSVTSSGSSSNSSSSSSTVRGSAAGNKGKSGAATTAPHNVNIVGSKGGNSGPKSLHGSRSAENTAPVNWNKQMANKNIAKFH